MVTVGSLRCPCLPYGPRVLRPSGPRRARQTRECRFVTCACACVADPGVSFRHLCVRVRVRVLPARDLLKPEVMLEVAELTRKRLELEAAE